jgi:type I restriction enzyme R subunit
MMSLISKVDAFNRQVITKDFNRVICEQLAQEIDPFGDEKTMIFCATDAHADMVVRLLGDAFKDIYNGGYNQAAVAKITGKSDKVNQLIRQYKNERYPSIAVTVDLLTTGIDVPKICNLVFMRRVKSRILYEQMIGRATRRCDEIGKTVFVSMTLWIFMLLCRCKYHEAVSKRPECNSRTTR